MKIELTLLMAIGLLTATSLPDQFYGYQNVPGTLVADYRVGALINVPYQLTNPYYLAAKSGCPISDRPVCGVDGKTYQNECFLTVAGVRKSYDGWCIDLEGGNEHYPCHEPNCHKRVDVFAETEEHGFGPFAEWSPQRLCPCNDNQYLVCGSNGITYANLCRAKCVGVAPVQIGPCGVFYYKPPKDKLCTCPFRQEKVCAKSGVTYESTCVMHCDNAEFFDLDFCKRPCNCQFIYKPVCGVDGRNYVNACELNCRKTEMAYEGLCDEGHKRKCFHCFGNKSYVCGEDYKTYDNLCYLKCNRVALKHSGPCLPIQVDKCVCPQLYLPVCSSTNHTYNNECEAKCKNEKIAYNGVCKPITPPSLPELPNQACLKRCARYGLCKLCASDRRTYGNRCAMRCISRDIKMIHRKPCRPIQDTQCACNTHYQPICGVDGKTYLNICTLNCLGMNKSWDGPCGVIGNYGYIMDQYYKGKTGAGPSNTRRHKKKSGYMFKLPTINTICEKPEKLKVNKHGGKISCPELDEIIAALYPGEKVLDVKTFKGLGLKDEQTKKEIISHPVKLFFGSDYRKSRSEKSSKDSKGSLGQSLGKEFFFADKNFVTIPERYKAKISQNPYLYYAYFYSLLYWGKITPNTKVEDSCEVKDILLYICIEFFKITPKFEDPLHHPIVSKRIYEEITGAKNFKEWLQKNWKEHNRETTEKHSGVQIYSDPRTNGSRTFVFVGDSLE
jgi:hypothetical protein